ncbi:MULTISPECIES: hypothetical protein [unclassified Guyparkeria]|uniref:hypothetical protein n=1 Tax=unclassified Guyparkeria TaxID=2626246 RepID=UPI00073354A9|nr:MULTISPECIES: hypothetical protein [unclassified Guyparkeria]KTG16633.1 hypothetical protein AUR63_00795 [Guyparkeria sp. XI15]OAE85667.1 hypothetical protein AWR35_00795 [Guyparkeria sp. WRN-7]
MKQAVTSLLAMLLGLAAMAGPAHADIPLPKPDRETDRFAEAIELGPIEPLPPIARSTSEAGAGRAPEGVIVSTEVTRLDPVQRETFLVTQTILDPARQVREVEVHRPEGEGIDARPLAVTRDTVEIDGRLVDRRHYRWAVQALRGGELRLEFSRIDFEVVGLAQSEYAFVPVARRLDVVELPAHLPTYLPVTPELAVEGVAVDALVAGEPGGWQFRVRGEGLTAEALSRLIDAQLVAPPGLRLGSPAIHELGSDSAEALPAAERISPLASIWQVDISLLPTVEGGADGRREADLPSLRLPYIDPRAADPGVELDYVRLDARTVTWEAEPTERRLAALWAALPWLLAGLAAAVVLVITGRRVWRYWQARRARRAARRRLRACEEPQALRRQLLAELNALPSLVRPVTHERLAQRGASEEWLVALATLESWCFDPQQRPQPDEFDTLRQRLIEGLPAHWFR